MDIQKGDYVLATKYSDGDPGDHWAVGFYDRTETYDGTGAPRHFVVDNEGNQLRAGGFRRIGHIVPDYGKWLLSNAKALEVSPPGSVDLWGMMGVNASPDDEEAQ